jgi:hypothetical protein
LREAKHTGGMIAAMESIIGIAPTGLDRETARFQGAAQRVARNPDDAAAIVDTQTAAIGFKADIAVLKTADEMAKTALDILA